MRRSELLLAAVLLSKVVDGPGHRAHIAGLEPIACNDCHVIEAEVFHRPTKARGRAARRDRHRLGP